MKRYHTTDFLIDGAPMLVPDCGIGVDYNDLIDSNSGRDESGYMHQTVVRSEMRTWHFQYAWLTEQEYKYIRSLLKGKSAFKFTFKDDGGIMQTVKAYSNSKSVSYWSARRGLYKNLNFDIVEC